MPKSSPQPTTELLPTPEGHLLATRSLGAGPALLCTPGGPGGFGRALEVCLAPLARRFRLVFWDYRGCGDSGTSSDISMAADLRDLEFLAHNLLPEKPILLGHSYGGMLCQSLAVNQPERCRALILIQTVRHYGALVAANSRLKIHRGSNESVELASLLGRLMRGDQDPNTYLEYRRRSAPASLHNQEVLADLLQLQHVNFPVRLQVQRDILNFDVRNRLRSLTMPTLITGSSHDLTCGSEPREIHREIPGSRYLEFSQSAHVPHLEERDRFLQEVEKWLDEVIPTSRDGRS